MKLRPVFVLCAGILFATAPAWADKVPCCEFVKGSPVGISADSVRGFEIPGNAMDSWSSEPSMAKDTLFSFSFSRRDTFFDFLSGFGSHERFFDNPKPEKGWFDGRGDGRNTRGNETTPRSVPEPGSFALLLLGMSAVGVVARRR